MKRSFPLPACRTRRFAETVALRTLCQIILGGALTVGLGGAAPASQDWVVATTATRVQTIAAFATVQSSGLISVAAAQPGVVAGLTILPGQTVTAGQPIAQLRGPQISAASIQARASLQTARAVERAASESLAAEKQNLLQHLSTRQRAAQAESALVAARARTSAAQANLDMLEKSMALRSPLAGIVQTVMVANGDLLATGQVVATIQPDSEIWLKAVLYGAAVPAGATGTFTPANGTSAMKVSLRGAFGIAQSDGGMPVALTASQPLAPGTFGTVTLDLPARQVTTVPSEALILDKGRWWVMRHDASGVHPVQVIPGAAAGYDTVIKSGLKPGDQVVAVNAYLLYHRGIAALYQPPD